MATFPDDRSTKVTVIFTNSDITETDGVNLPE